MANTIAGVVPVARSFGKYSPVEYISWFKSQPLTIGTLSTFSKHFPMGRFVRRIFLDITFNITHSNATTALSDGVLRAIKGISFVSAMSERYYNSIPGLGFAILHKINRHFTMNYDALSATPSSGAYVAHVVIDFSDESMDYPDDTIYNGRLYTSEPTIEINIGTVSDLITTPASDTLDTVTATATCECLRDDAPIWPAIRREVSMKQVINPSSDPVYSFEKNVDLAYKRIIFQAGDAGAASVVPFVGTPNDVLVSSLLLDSDKRRYVDDIGWVTLKDIGWENYNLAGVTGQVIIDFCNPGSQGAALDSTPNSADKPEGLSRLDATFTLGTVGSYPRISIMTDAIRSFKAA